MIYMPLNMGRDRNSPNRIKWMFSSQKWSDSIGMGFISFHLCQICDLTHSKFIETSQNCHAMPWQNDCGWRCQILWDGFSGQDSRKDHQVRIQKSWKIGMSDKISVGGGSLEDFFKLMGSLKLSVCGSHSHASSYLRWELYLADEWGKLTVTFCSPSVHLRY